MSNKFQLIVKDKTITKLSGNTLGRKTFEEQLMGKIDYSQPITITLPQNVDNIGSSFVQGFFSEIVEKIGISGVEKKVDILSENIPNAKEYILKKLD